MFKLGACALIASAGLVSIASADTLDMRGTDNAARFEHPGKPGRGMSQAGVEQKFGAPQARRAAVGEPPISRWEYSDFVVFFEYDRVIHSVSKR